MIINWRGQKGTWPCMCLSCLTPKLGNYGAIQVQLDSLNYLRTKFDPYSILTFISNGSTQVHFIDFQYTPSIRKRHMHAQQCLQSIISQLLWVWCNRKQSAVAPQRSSLKLQRELALWLSLSTIYQTRFSKKRLHTEGFPNPVTYKDYNNIITVQKVFPY